MNTRYYQHKCKVLLSNPHSLLASIKAIKSKRVRDHVHIACCFRWRGTAEDLAILKDGIDLWLPLTEFATPSEMRAAMLAIGLPEKMADESAKQIESANSVRTYANKSHAKYDPRKDDRHEIVEYSFRTPKMQHGVYGWLSFI